MLKKTIIIPVLGALLLSACTPAINSGSGFASGDQPSYCEGEGKPVCIMGGIFAAGLIAGIIANSGGSGSRSGGGCPGLCNRHR